MKHRQENICRSNMGKRNISRSNIGKRNIGRENSRGNISKSIIDLLVEQVTYADCDNTKEFKNDVTNVLRGLKKCDGFKPSEFRAWSKNATMLTVTIASI